MNEMLHGLNEDRRLAALERENPLHPQDPRAVTMRKQAEPEAERGPADRPVMLNHTSGDPVMARRVGGRGCFPARRTSDLSGRIGGQQDFRRRIAGFDHLDPRESD